MKHFPKWFQAVNVIYVIQHNFEIQGVGVAIMDISQQILLINVIPAVYNMHEFYRKILSHQPIISVEYWQAYEGNDVVH